MQAGGLSTNELTPFPSQVIVDVTERCNYACVHCPHKDFVKSGIYTGADLDVGLNKKLVDEVSSEGYGTCEYLRYTANGEPLLHKDIMEMLRYACEHSKTRINLTTNGSLLTERKAKQIVDMGVTVVDISLDAYNYKTYSKIRVNGNLAQVEENVLFLIDYIKLGGYNTKVIVSFVEQEKNSDEITKFNSFWKTMSADYVVIRNLHSNAGADSEIGDELRGVGDMTDRLPCRYPWERLTLTPRGAIAYCPVDWHYTSQIYSFREHTIKEAWNSEHMRMLREAHIEGDYANFPLCDNCPDWVYCSINNNERYSTLMERLPKDLLE